MLSAARWQHGRGRGCWLLASDWLVGVVGQVIRVGDAVGTRNNLRRKNLVVFVHVNPLRQLLLSHQQAETPNWHRLDAFSEVCVRIGELCQVIVTLSDYLAAERPRIY